MTGQLWDLKRSVRYVYNYSITLYIVIGIVNS